MEEPSPEDTLTTTPPTPPPPPTSTVPKKGRKALKINTRKLATLSKQFSKEDLEAQGIYNSFVDDQTDITSTATNLDSKSVTLNSIPDEFKEEEEEEEEGKDYIQQQKIYDSLLEEEKVEVEVEVKDPKKEEDDGYNGSNIYQPVNPNYQGYGEAFSHEDLQVIDETEAAEKEQQKKIAETTLNLCLSSQDTIDFTSLWELMNRLPVDSTSMDNFGIDEVAMQEVDNIRDPLQTSMVMGFAGCGVSIYRLVYLMWHIISNYKKQGLVLAQVQNCTERMSTNLAEGHSRSNAEVQSMHEDYKRLGDDYRYTIRDMYEKQLGEKERQIELLTSSLEILKENQKVKKTELQEWKTKVKSLEKTLQGHLTEFQTGAPYQMHQGRRLVGGGGGRPAVTTSITTNQITQQQSTALRRNVMLQGEEITETKKRERLAAISGMVYFNKSK